ncbi:hypothetical protein UFOVP1624_27 [uncultured Caudovirales phage]|uniref:Uncharacterized protein n=1 Tax=uncultured Caudovirales phage TaxID=2100421 RepID=A0A6J5SY96_9CAUD|nr:hypothetical protein UFOVP1624_27 [uncultured Caudovirales phage]
MEKFNLSNYAKQNTPAWAQKIGDISLACGAVGAAILAIPMAAPIVLPVALVSAAGWLLGVGTIGKAIMKCYGE